MRSRNPVPLGSPVSAGSGGGVSTYTPTVTQAGNTFTGVTGRAALINGVGFVWVSFTAVSTVAGAGVSITTPWAASISALAIGVLIDQSAGAVLANGLMIANALNVSSPGLISASGPAPTLTAGHFYMLNYSYPVG